MMPTSGCRAGVEIVHGELAPPCFPARILAREEGVEGNGLVLEPGAAGRAEIGHAALRRDPGAGEWRDDLGRCQPLGQHFEILIESCGSQCSHRPRPYSRTWAIQAAGGGHRNRAQAARNSSTLVRARAASSRIAAQSPAATAVAGVSHVPPTHITIFWAR